MAGHEKWALCDAEAFVATYPIPDEDRETLVDMLVSGQCDRSHVVKVAQLHEEATTFMAMEDRL